MNISRLISGVVGELKSNSVKTRSYYSSQAQEEVKKKRRKHRKPTTPKPQVKEVRNDYLTYQVNSNIGLGSFSFNNNNIQKQPNKKKQPTPQPKQNTFFNELFSQEAKDKAFIERAKKFERLNKERESPNYKPSFFSQEAREQRFKQRADKYEKLNTQREDRARLEENSKKYKQEKAWWEK